MPFSQKTGIVGGEDCGVGELSAECGQSAQIDESIARLKFPTAAPATGGFRLPRAVLHSLRVLLIGDLVAAEHIAMA